MVDMETLMTRLRQHAPKLRSLGYRVRFDLTDVAESIMLDATGGAAEVDAGSGEAETVLRLSSDDLGRLIAGRLSPMLAFTTGRLKVEGSRGVAMKLASLLDQD
jgi:putative sterol carrier protein